MKRSISSVLAMATLASLAPSQNLPTILAGGNGGGVNWSNYFDITVNNTITLLGLDVNINLAAAGAIGSVDVYMTPAGTSFVANEANPVWTLMSSGVETVSEAIGTGTPVCLDTPISITPGTYGVAIHYRGAFTPSYTNGTGMNEIYSNADLTLTAGSSTDNLPGTAGAALFTPRVWNGTLYYNEYACARTVGEGCGNNGPGAVYESFDGTNTIFDFTPGTGWQVAFTQGEYVAVTGSSPIVPPTSPPVLFFDDLTRQISLPTPLPTRNGPLNALSVCSNGWVGLVQTNVNDFDDSAEALINGENRIFGLWADLDPSAGGTIHAEADTSNPTTFHVTWTDVPDKATNATNTFQMSFDLASGGIEVKYGNTNVAGATIGYANGGGTFDLGPTDMSNPALTVMTMPGDRGNLVLRSGRPLAMQTVTFETSEIPSNAFAGAVLFGFTGFNPGLDLSFLGMPGCVLTTGGTASLPFTPNMPSVSASLPLGNTAGATIFLQSAVIAPGVNQLGVATSNGVTWSIANQ